MSTLRTNPTPNIHDEVDAIHDEFRELAYKPEYQYPSQRHLTSRGVSSAKRPEAKILYRNPEAQRQPQPEPRLDAQPKQQTYVLYPHSQQQLRYQPPQYQPPQYRLQQPQPQYQPPQYQPQYQPQPMPTVYMNYKDIDSLPGGMVEYLDKLTRYREEELRRHRDTLYV